MYAFVQQQQLLAKGLLWCQITGLGQNAKQIYSQSLLDTYIS